VVFAFQDGAGEGRSMVRLGYFGPVGHDGAFGSEKGAFSSVHKNFPNSIAISTPDGIKSL
jgi:hypothetical protein